LLDRHGGDASARESNASLVNEPSEKRDRSSDHHSRYRRRRDCTDGALSRSLAKPSQSLLDETPMVRPQNFA
jgi:hypothetical protein